MHELVKILGGVINKARMWAVIIRAVDHTFSALLTELETIKDRFALISSKRISELHDR